MRLPLLGLSLLLVSASPLAGQGTIVSDRLNGGVTNERDSYKARVRDATVDVVELYQLFWNAGAADNLSRLYTSDPSIFGATGEVVRGREAVAAHIQSQLASSGEIEVQVQEFDTSGELAFLVVTTSSAVSGQAGTRPVAGTMLLVLRRGDRDDWKIDTQVSSVRTAAAASGATAETAAPQE